MTYSIGSGEHFIQNKQTNKQYATIKPIWYVILLQEKYNDPVV